MSRLSQYRELERLIAKQTAGLETLKNDPQLKREIEFETSLLELMAEYGKALKDVVAILDPSASSRSRAVPANPDKRPRRARTLKVYRNPLTGETVQSKGGNNKTLGAWKAQFGHDEVESWVKS